MMKVCGIFECGSNEFGMRDIDSPGGATASSRGRKPPERVGLLVSPGGATAVWISELPSPLWG